MTSTELYTWAPKIIDALLHEPELTDVNSDQQQNGLETDLVIDRDTAARLGITAAAIDNTLYDAFGQRQVSTIYKALNQYHVVMEVAPQYWQSPETLKEHLCQHRGRRGQRHAIDQRGRRHRGGGAAASASSQSATAAQIATDAARNLAANQIGATGHAAQRLDRRRRHHQRRDHGAARRLHAITDRARRRSPSIIRARSSPPPSRSTWPPGKSLSDATAAINTGDGASSTCRPPSTAASRARRRSSSSRSATSRS